MKERLVGLGLDMDGVLLDSSIMLLDYYNNILDQAGHTLPVHIEDVMKCFHMSKREALKTLARIDDHTEGGRAEVNRLLEIAKETQRDTTYLKVREGAEEFLYRAREKVVLSIVTNADDETPNEFFDMLPGTERLFSAVITAQTKKPINPDDTIERRSRMPLKPEPDMIHTAMHEMGTKPHETAYVGDSPTDIKAARAAKVTALLIKRPRQDLPASNTWEDKPDLVVNDLEELYLVISALARINRVRSNKARAHTSYGPLRAASQHRE